MATVIPPRARKRPRLTPVSLEAVSECVSFLSSTLAVAAIHYLDELTAARELKLVEYLRKTYNRHEQKALREALTQRWLQRGYPAKAVEDLWSK